MSFDPQRWARAWETVGQQGARNLSGDHGWSADVAREVCRKTAELLLEIYAELQNVDLLPADFFDRPELAAVLSAVHESTRITLEG